MDKKEKDDFKFNLDVIDGSFAKYEIGNIFNAIVVNKNSKGIVVNIGGKHDGLIREEEAKEYSVLNKGAKIDVMITESKGDEGYVIVSAKKAEEMLKQNVLIPDIKNGGEFSAVVSAVTRSGLVCRFGSYKVFIPAGEVEERYVKNLEGYKGKTLRLVAIDFDEANKQMVASQAKILKKEKLQEQESFWNTIFVNKVVKGKVVRFAPFGVFVNVDGVDCLVHNTEISFNREAKATEVLVLNNEYEFKVISLDRENGRVQLSYKATQEHPFAKQIKDYKVGDIVDVEVVRILPYGAISKLSNGLEGMINISEASNRFIKNINEICKVGDKKTVQIINIDESSHKVALSIKALIKTAEEEEAAGEVISAKKTQKEEK